jgi:phosphoribosylanthranilate isomerase
MDAPPLVKICGIRSVDAALAAATAGADLLGFNFAPVSRRRVAPELARQAILAVRQRAAARRPPAMAGIFVNQPPAEVAALAAGCALDYLQLSGDEDVAYCREVAALTGLPVIKAVRLGLPDGAARAEEFAACGAVRALLADAAVAGSWGGAGQVWDWPLAAGLAARFPLLLAGGLTPANVRAAIDLVRPWGVDVASGVETDGQLDPTKVRNFIQLVKEDRSHGNRDRATDGGQA